MTDGRREPRQLRSRQTVAWVLDAAAQLFHEHGYAGTTTNKVAERAGVSVGSIYQYFPNKDALLAALAERHMDHAAEAAVEAVQRAAAARSTLPDLIRGLVECVVGLHTSEPDLHWLMAREAVHRPELMDRLAAVEHRVAAPLAEELRRLDAGGDDPETLALLTVQGVNAQVHGALLNPPGTRTSHEVADAIVALWTAGLDR